MKQNSFYFIKIGPPVRTLGKYELIMAGRTDTGVAV